MMFTRDVHGNEWSPCEGCPHPTRGACPSRANPALCKHRRRRPDVFDAQIAAMPACLDAPAERRPEVPPIAPPADLPTLDEWTFVTTDRLLRDTRMLADRLPPDIDLVVAIVRSGLLPGSLLATQLHAPLRTVSQQGGVINPGHGGRMVGRDHLPPAHVLLIDDTAATGHEMASCEPLVRAAYPDARLTRAVVYCHPQAFGRVDLCTSLYPGEHYLEWNFANAGHGADAYFDFDGVLVPDMTPPEWTLEAVLKMQATQPPLYLPRRSPVPAIVTGRGEESRAVCEAWLARWGVRYGQLLMRPDSVGHDWESIAAFKARHYAEGPVSLFIESSRRQSARINELTGKAVLCPKGGKVFPPRRVASIVPPPADPTADPDYARLYAAALDCPDATPIPGVGCRQRCRRANGGEVSITDRCLPCRREALSA